jgi:hypothetical protein
LSAFFTRTLGQALEECSSRTSVLVTLKHCNELETLRQELIQKEYAQNQEFMIGTFAYGLTTATEIRRVDGAIDWFTNS